MKSNIPQIILDIITVRKGRWGMVRDPLFYNVLSLLNEEKDICLAKFQISWRVSTKNSILQSKRVDLLSEFDQFSKKEKKIILQNLLAIELTTGCNGGCYYCVSGQKFKIYERYSFSSVKKFYNKYHGFLNDKMPPLLYWDSDAFIYEDKDAFGSYDLRDIYKLIFDSKGKGKFTPFISTTIPMGSQLKFILFMKDLLNSYFLNNYSLPTIRISLGKHNVTRVEAVLVFLWKWLIKEGFSEQIVKTFMNQVLTFDIRDEETVMNVGPLIKLGDKYKDIISPNTDEGYLLSPKNTRVLAISSASTYEPLGATVTMIKPGNVEEYLVSRDTLYNYAHYFYDTFYKRDKKEFEDQIDLIIKNGTIFLPNIKYSNEFFSISRWSISIRHFLSFYAQLEGISEDKLDYFTKFSYKEFIYLRKEMVQDLVKSIRKYKIEKNIFSQKYQKSCISVFIFYFVLINIFFLFFESKQFNKNLINKAKLLISYDSSNQRDVFLFARLLLSDRNIKLL